MTQWGVIKTIGKTPGWSAAKHEAVPVAADTGRRSSQCMKHGKRRGMEHLVDDGYGGLVCRHDSQCQVSGWDEKVRPRGMCSIHRKVRSTNVLYDDGNGGWRCNPEDPRSACQIHDAETRPRVRAICSVHGKERSSDCLMADGKGGFKCTPADSCKPAGSKITRDRNRGAQDSGPSLPRSQISQEYLRGVISSVYAGFGWITPDAPVWHPAAAKNDGQVYFHMSDATAPVRAGMRCQFKLYADASGLGAESVYPM